MSIRISQLPLFVNPSPLDMVPIDQGNPPTTRRIPLQNLQPVAFTINFQAGLTYNPVAADGFNTVIGMTNAAANVITIPSASTLNYIVGTVILALQYGAGQISIVGAGGVVIRNSSSGNTRAQYSLIAVIKLAVNEWVVVGDFA